LSNKEIRAHRGKLIALMAANALCALVAVPVALLGAATFLGPPHAGEHLAGWVIFFAILWIPGWFIAGACLGWLLHQRAWIRTSLAVAGAPFIGGVVLLIAGVLVDSWMPLAIVGIALALLFIGAAVASRNAPTGERATKIVGIIFNVFLPGVGTMLVGRTRLGALQLALWALAGFLMAIEFFEIVMGMLSMTVWIWAIISSAIAEEKPIPAIVATEAHGA
jgi:hypothetical protein